MIRWGIKCSFNCVWSNNIKRRKNEPSTETVVKNGTKIMIKSELTHICVLQSVHLVFADICVCACGLGGHAAVVPALPSSTSAHIQHCCSTGKHRHRLQQGARTGDPQTQLCVLCFCDGADWFKYLPFYFNVCTSETMKHIWCVHSIMVQKHDTNQSNLIPIQKNTVELFSDLFFDSFVQFH